MKTKNAKVEKTTDKKAEQKQDSANVKVIIAKGSKKNQLERKTKVKEKNFMYNFQLDKTKNLKPKEEKKIRSKIRRDLQLIVNAIIISKADKQKEAIKEFNSFYKKNYILNDFSLQSITNSGDELKVQDFTKVLALAKEQMKK